MTLPELYDARLDSPRSINYYSGFDCYCDAVFFSLCDGDTGEELKSYEVSFDEDTGEVDPDVEFTTESDSGYCDFKRLPKCVREHVLAIVKAYIEEQAKECPKEAEEKAEMETLKTVETADFTEEQQVQFIAGFEAAGGYTGDLDESPAPCGIMETQKSRCSETIRRLGALSGGINASQRSPQLPKCKTL